ncbi:MAG: hypothetical protein KIT84_18435 [Labilithrix sp.]|nr:hypothetical protein [Labilithrix sp.]MCW5813012.1 hypothetical protein [Labilithrix sp.]
MPDTDALKQWGLGAFAVLLLVGTGVKVCGGGPPPKPVPVVVAPEPSAAPPVVAAPLPKSKVGLSAPIAAAWMPGGDVVVAGLDVPTRTIRVQRIDKLDAVVANEPAFDDVAWSTDADLKVAASAEGAFVTWRGLRGGKLVRELAFFGPDLAKRGAPIDVAAASCATRAGIWFADAALVTSVGWSGDRATFALPKDKEAALLCSATRAYAVLEEDEQTSILPLHDDAGAPVVMTRESDFGEDDQRELAEYTVGDEVGVVRLALSGAVALRETKAGVPDALHKLATTIGRDDDVVAVDATSKMVVIVYTQDAAGCKADETGSRVMALRVDRRSFEESVVELAPARCGGENGPFFTGVLEDQLSVAWVERTAGVGKARAPIAGLTHTHVDLLGAPIATHLDQPADAIVDAGCDGAKCFAVALVRHDAEDAKTPGYARVIRW